MKNKKIKSLPAKVASFLLCTSLISTAAFSAVEPISHPTCELNVIYFSEEIRNGMNRDYEELGAAFSSEYATDKLAKLAADFLPLLGVNKKLNKLLIKKGYFPIAKEMNRLNFDKGFLQELKIDDLSLGFNYNLNYEALWDGVSYRASFDLKQVTKASNGMNDEKVLFSNAEGSDDVTLDSVPWDEVIKTALENLPECRRQGQKRGLVGRPRSLTQ